MSRPAKITYKATDWRAYNQALGQRGSLTVWFDPSVQWEAIPSGRRGRQQAYSDAASQACLTIKVLLACRHAKPPAFPTVIISDMTAPLCGSLQTHLGTQMPSGGDHIINALWTPTDLRNSATPQIPVALLAAL